MLSRSKREVPGRCTSEDWQTGVRRTRPMERPKEEEKKNNTQMGGVNTHKKLWKHQYRALSKQKRQINTNLYIYKMGMKKLFYSGNPIRKKKKKSHSLQNGKSITSLNHT